jgi:hypothetical protein
MVDGALLVMLVAVLTACLVSAPTDCRRHEIFLEAVMPTQAWVEANTRAATWVAEHPGYVKADLRVLPGRGA